MSNQTHNESLAPAQNAAPKAIDEAKLTVYLNSIKFSKTISQTYQSLGADLSSGDVRSKAIFARLSEVCNIQTAESYKGDTFEYVVFDVDFQYDDMPVAGIISTARSLHLKLAQNVTF